MNIYSSKMVHTRMQPICDLPRYRELCDAANIPRRRLQNSLGSGVIVRSDGYILTNAHVIADADEILVAFFDGQTTSAQIIGTDPETDLAVIRANATGLKPIEMGHLTTRAWAMSCSPSAIRLVSAKPSLWASSVQRAATASSSSPTTTSCKPMLRSIRAIRAAR